MRVKYLIPIIALILIFNFALACNGCENSTEGISKVEEEEEEYSIEYQLAVINAGGFVEEDDETVQEFKRLLDKLEKKVVNSKQDIADIAVKAQEVLKDDGYNIELIQVMRDLNTAIPEELEDVKLEEIAAAYMVLIKKQ